MNIFELGSDFENYSSFIEDYPKGCISIISRSIEQRWGAFDDEFSPVTLKLQKSDNGQKNYNFDFSAALKPFLIFSEIAIEELHSLIVNHGQILPISSESKRKKFWGYYPINPIFNCLDLTSSIYDQYEKGMVIQTPILLKERLPKSNIFVINEDVSRIFVTEKFKEKVEKSGLLGFDFSRVVDVV